MQLLIRLLVNALAILLVAYFVPGVAVSSFLTALVVALVLGLLNVIIKPILVILTLPINILTLGLFTLVINALLFWFASTFISGFSVSGFAAAFFGALIVSAVNFFAHRLITDND
jgi:putative membrane protein